MPFTYSTLRLVDLTTVSSVVSNVSASSDSTSSVSTLKTAPSPATTRITIHGYLSPTPRTEQFAIGSVFYYMNRGNEPYDNEWFGEDHGKMVVSLLQEKKFPEVYENDIDTIIHKCWHGKYGSVRSLKLEVIYLGRDIRLSMAKAMPKEEYEARRQECKKLLELEVLGKTPRGE